MSFKPQAGAIFRSAIEAVSPRRLIPESIRIKGDALIVDGNRYALPERGKCYLFGSGKAVASMANATISLLGERIAGGLLVGSRAGERVEKATYMEGCHPYPCQKSIEAGEKMIEAFSSMKEEDFFIYLLSGGSSALMEVPMAPVTLRELQETTRLLLSHAVSIDAINCVRKHLSKIKGGRLARATKAEGVVLVVSDVIGDDLEAIGSAPLYKDGTTREEAISILQNAGLWRNVPAHVRALLRDPRCETPKRKRKGVAHHIVGNNEKALAAAAKKAEELGMQTRIVTDRLEGEVEAVAERIVREILDAPVSDRPLSLLFGGEPTVEVAGTGKGGRNQHLALLVLKKIRHHPRITFLSGATDGIDGNSEAAGGVVEAEDYAPDMLLAIENYDAYHYLKKHDALLVTGPTDTNVMDLMIAIKGV